MNSIDIIGGGIIGITLATELLREIRKHGLKTEVHLFERKGRLGSENTEKSFEGVRTYWFTEEEIPFYLTGIRAVEDLADYFGTDAPAGERITASYRPVGYHYFLSKEEFQAVQKLKKIWDNAGVPISFYTKEEVKKIEWITNNFDLNARILDSDAWVNNHFDLDRWMKNGFDTDCIVPNDERYWFTIAGYVHVPVAGFISAPDVVDSYRSVFKYLGGSLHLNTEVVGLEKEGNRICTVAFTSNSDRMQSKSTDYVINAAGVWSETFNRMVLDEALGVTPHRRYAHIVQPPKGYDNRHGMVLLKGRVIRPDGDKFWLYYTPPDERPGIEETQPDNRTYDAYYFKYIHPVFCDFRKPFIRCADTLGLYGSVDARGWMGHYADTPDERPLIGVPRPDRISNYAVSTGYSGHGVQASIAAALSLTHHILQLDGEPSVVIPEIYSASRDLSRYKPDRSRL